MRVVGTGEVIGGHVFTLGGYKRLPHQRFNTRYFHKVSERFTRCSYNKIFMSN